MNALLPALEALGEEYRTQHQGRDRQRGGDQGNCPECLGIGLRSVEKHVSSIFAKLALEEESSVNRRVLAVLLVLSDLR